MTKLISTIVIISFFLFSCTDKEEKGRLEFVRLDKISTNEDATKEYFVTERYTERFLVINPPEEYKIVDSLVLDYFIKTSRKKICSFNTSIDKYHISFYRENSCTSYFLEHKEDRQHQINGDEQAGGCEGELKMLYYHRSETNPQMWYASFPKNIRDTIYCDSIIPVPPLVYEKENVIKEEIKEEEYINKGTKQSPQPCEHSYLDVFYYKPLSEDSSVWYNEISGDTLYCSQIIK